MVFSGALSRASGVLGLFLESKVRQGVLSSASGAEGVLWQSPLCFDVAVPSCFLGPNPRGLHFPHPGRNSYFRFNSPHTGREILIFVSTLLHFHTFRAPNNTSVPLSVCDMPRAGPSSYTCLIHRLELLADREDLGSAAESSPQSQPTYSAAQDYTNALNT